MNIYAQIFHMTILCVMKYTLFYKVPRQTHIDYSEAVRFIFKNRQNTYFKTPKLMLQQLDMAIVGTKQQIAKKLAYQMFQQA